MRQDRFWSRCRAAAMLLLLASAAARAGDLRMVAPIIPPHFDADGRGRIGDVVAATLARCGWRAVFVMVPFGRHWKEYEDHAGFDGLATAEADQSFPGFSTRPFMHLQDGATVMAGQSLHGIRSVEQLYGHHVVAFPSAQQILGLGDQVARFASYRERSNRLDQIRPLFANRADAILADGLITAHFVELVRAHAAAGGEPDIDTTPAVVFRRIFPPGPQRLYFRDQAVASGFDRCFAELLQMGEVALLTKPYLDRYRSIVGDQYPDY